MNLEQLLEQPAHLPSMPAAVQQLIVSLGDDDICIDDIAQHIQSDPVLAAKTLRLANSAYFHLTRQVATVSEAVQMLGLSMIRNLALASSLVQTFGQVPGMHLPTFWRHSVSTASGARWLALATGKAHGDTAFIVGLMSGVGQLMLHAAAPSLVEPIDAKLDWLHPGRAALERRKLGLHHGVIGSALAARWHFPQGLVEALCKLPDDAAPDDPPMLALVRLAAAWSRAGLSGRPDEAIEAPDLQASLATVGAVVTNDDAGLRLCVCGADGLQTMPTSSELLGGLEALLPHQGPWPPGAPAPRGCAASAA